MGVGTKQRNGWVSGEGHVRGGTVRSGSCHGICDGSKNPSTRRGGERRSHARSALETGQAGAYECEASVDLQSV